MKILGINNEDTKLVITLFNKKFVINKTDDVYRTILSSWNKDGCSENLISILRLIYFNSKYWDLNYKDIWLIYICCLLKKQDKNTALKVLHHYVLKFGLSNIEQFLPVAKLAVLNGINSESIEYAAQLFDMFELNKNNSWLDSLINKSIAVVGNGSQLQGLGKGKEIDSHDVVIRFNKFTTKGFEEDCGKRTDIWVTLSTLKENLEVDNLDFIILANHYDYWTHKVDLKFTKQIIKNNSNIHIISKEIMEDARNYLGTDFYNPTTGCALILCLYKKFRNLDNVDFYGFGFLNDKFKPLDHYYTKVSKRHSKKAQEMHSFEEESRFLKQFVQNAKFVE